MTHTGNTKVYKPSEGKDSIVGQRQHLSVELASDAFLVLLPAPVTCYARASYAQTQRFNLPVDGSASIVLLDWLTSGRDARGERWAFSRCRTENLVRVGEKTIARDVLLLEDDRKADTTSYRSAVEPYSCYGTLILHGPKTKALCEAFAKEWDEARVVRPVRSDKAGPQPVLWSYCAIDGGRGGVVRIAGLQTQQVRDWLRDRLRPLEAELGNDLYRACWS